MTDTTRDAVIARYEDACTWPGSREAVGAALADIPELLAEVARLEAELAVKAEALQQCEELRVDVTVELARLEAERADVDGGTKLATTQENDDG